MDPYADLSIEQLRMDKDLRKYGFYVEFEYHHTMFRKDTADGNYIWISDEGGMSLPNSYLQEITVGVYDHDGVHIFYRQYEGGIREFLDELENKIITLGDA